MRPSTTRIKRIRIGAALALCLIALCCLLNGCSTITITEEQPAKPVAQLIPSKLALVHTGAACGTFAQEGMPSGVAVAAKQAESYRDEGFDVLLLDGGDTMSGTDLVDLSLGEEAVGFLNAAGYDALAVGALELDLGAETLRSRDRQADFPFICANASVPEADDELPAHEVFPLSDGRKVGVFALAPTETLSPAAAREFELSQDIIDTAQQQVATLRAEDCRLIVCLTSAASSDSSPDATTLASQVSGIDVLIDSGANEPTWKVVADASGDDTLVVSSTATSQAVTVVTWERGKLDVKSCAIDTGTSSNEQVDALVSQAGLEVEQRLAQVVAANPHELAAPGTADRGLALGDLVADALLWQGRRSAPTKPVAAVLPTGTLVAGLPEGELTRAMAHEVIPHAQGRLCTFELTGAQLQQLLTDTCAGLPSASALMPQVSGLAGTIELGEGTASVAVTSVGEGDFSATETYGIVTVEAALYGEHALPLPDEVIGGSRRLEDDAGGALAAYLTRVCKGNLADQYVEAQERLAVEDDTTEDDTTEEGTAEEAEETSY